ncbi:MAG: PEP-CTERM-box response regulator transcription factor [Opitutaceae bacterium]|nr:PEP-CTERM-box response regulator transcription factor [Opitutaceae bacterium]
MKPRLLIVDDDEEIRTQMKWALSKDYDLSLAADRDTALSAFRQYQPAVVLLDLGLPPEPANPEQGLGILGEMLAIDRRCKVIIISGQSERAIALRAVGAGAYDFHAKPVQLDELRLILKRCFHVALLEREFLEMRARMDQDAFEGMIGSSPQMQRVFESIRKVATTDAPVLIQGESGTGKEMVAQGIHQRSARRNGPFVPINCGAIPEALLESELFGHEKGAFTGAHVQRKGHIEAADGGTLFLDEVGELPPPLQVKLLRFLQEQRFSRVGGRGEIAVNVRVIAATNADLRKAMTTGAFREDLYYRLAVVEMALPPLREREGDIEVIARSFLDRFARENKKPGLSFASDAVRSMARHIWPGNIRELQNRVRRAVIMCDGRRLTAADLELDSAEAGTAMTSLKEAREQVEREMVTRALKRHHGKIAPAAVELGISRPTMYELMDKLGIQKGEPAKE